VAIADQHTGLAMSGRACLKLSRSAVLSKELSDLSPPSRFQFFHSFTDPPSQDGNCDYLGNNSEQASLVWKDQYRQGRHVFIDVPTQESQLMRTSRIAQ
jgi:hypothetical protein